MRGHLRFRFLPMLLLMVLAGLAASAAFAVPPTDQGLFPLDSVPDCVAGTQIQGGAQICKVHPFASGVDWQATTGEWIVVRGTYYIYGAGDALDQTYCQQIQSTLSVTFTIDGKTVPTDVIPCTYFGDPYDTWIADFRALSHPLTPGTHTIVEKLVFTQDIGGVFFAGDTSTETGTLTVVNGKKG